MAKNKGLGIRQTRGQFQFRGVVSGTEKDNFYKEGKTSTGRDYSSANFGIEFDKNSTVFMSLWGCEQDKVYFSQLSDDNSRTIVNVPWRDRFKQQSETGTALIGGVKLGLEKEIDSNGNEINKRQTLTKYDAAKEIANHLVDDESVFVRGDVEYSTYEGKHQTRFVPTQISLCRGQVDFDNEDFRVENKFTQEIIFMGIELNKGVVNEYKILAKVVNYNSIEDIELFTRNETLAKTLKKQLKPYTLIKVGGCIECQTDTETVEDTDDAWGCGIEMDKIKSPTIRKFIVTGADKSTIDTETYSEDIIDEAIAKVKAEERVNTEFSSATSTKKQAVKVEDDGDFGWGDSTDDDYDGEEW